MITDGIPEELIRRIHGSCLLALPQSAAKVLKLAKNPENGPPEYAVPISADPGLTMQILKFANSSFFGFRHKITTIQTALSLICVHTVKNFVLWNAVFALLPDPKVGPFQLKRIFRDALRRGVFCKVFASYCSSLDPEEVFVAGLFQDIAIPILAQQWPKQYETLLNRLDQDEEQLSLLEHRTFGWNHADAGALLVSEWGFDDRFAKTIREHAMSDFKNVVTQQELFDAVVRLSAFLPSSGHNDWKEADLFFAALHKILPKHLREDKKMPTPGDLFLETDLQFEDLLQITQTSLPKYSLTDFQRRYLSSFEEEHESEKERNEENLSG